MLWSGLGRLEEDLWEALDLVEEAFGGTRGSVQLLVGRQMAFWKFFHDLWLGLGTQVWNHLLRA